jgi:two-component system sensor histidine kinase AlgZ
MSPSMDTGRRRGGGSSRAYWLCQFGGWGLYTVYIATFAVMSNGFHVTSVLCIIALLTGLCPLVTHGLRAWMLRRRWMLLPPQRLLPRLAAVALALSVALTSLTFFFQITVLHTARWDKWWPGAAVPMILGYLMAFSIWLSIYFSVHARRRQRAFELKALQLEVVAHDAHLRSIESQLNPHFLFNCLNSVRALIVENPPRAQTMVTRLAELLRYSLKSDRPGAVTLGEELAAVGDYVDLERVRFEDRLAVDVAVEPGALRIPVPRMMILTLVENAVKHGIAQLPSGGGVWISARLADGHLKIEVANSGELQPGSEGGVGLANARERLRLLYGASASLTLTGRGNQTVLAALALPAAEATT